MIGDDSHHSLVICSFSHKSLLKQKHHQATLSHAYTHTPPKHVQAMTHAMDPSLPPLPPPYPLEHVSYLTVVEDRRREMLAQGTHGPFPVSVASMPLPRRDTHIPLNPLTFVELSIVLPP